MEIMRKLSFLLLLLCVSISVKNQNGQMNKGSQTLAWRPSYYSSSIFSSSSDSRASGFIRRLKDHKHRSLEYDYYRESCPQAERIVRNAVRSQHKVRPDIAPALLRLVFHDCFIEVGGPFYPLLTGRRDSALSFPELAANEIPSPQDDLPTIMEAFSSRGFDERETVTLLGAHSVGIVHCKFFKNRLYNFHNSGKPDPSIDAEFLDLMRSTCYNTESPSTSPPPSPSSASLATLQSAKGMKMDYEGPGTDFGALYYRGLMRNRGILFADQQLTAGEGTKNWVRAYASDPVLFRQDFAMAMMKLSNLSVLTAPMGLIRLHCAMVA
ncbi:hypothetical protein Ancab_035737 [Ancistrocladus abbreviatus]